MSLCGLSPFNEMRRQSNHTLGIVGGIVGLFALGACGGSPASLAELSTPATSPPAAVAADAPVYQCPMDRDIRSHDPGTCSRCGMKLVAAIPDLALETD